MDDLAVAGVQPHMANAAVEEDQIAVSELGLRGLPSDAVLLPGRMGQRKLSRFDYDVRCLTLPSGKPELVIWLALWAVGTVLAAEDRWLVEHAWLDPKCPYESTGGPRR